MWITSKKGKTFIRKSFIFVEVQSEYTDDDEENDEDLNKEVDKHVWNERFTSDSFVCVITKYVINLFIKWKLRKDKFKWRYDCRSGNSNFSNCKLTRKKNGDSNEIQTHDLCFNAEVLY